MGIRYWLWKRKVRKIAPERCSICCICDEPIYSDQFVGETSDGRLVHAGFHFSLKSGKNAFCETGAIGTGFWNGTAVQHVGASAICVAMHTGSPVVRTVGSGGVETRILDKS